jgi:hypothetical protein
VKVQAFVFPLVSAAVQVTVVTPLANVEPLAGTHATSTPGQLSVAEGSLHVTFVFEQVPESVEPAMFDGQAPITGFSVSSMVTVKVQAFVFPLVSVAVQVTVVTPLANVEPLAGTHATRTPGQLSVAEGSDHVTFVFEHVLESVPPVMFDGHAPMTGFSASFTTTLNEQVFVFRLVSDASHVTVVTPLGKVEPLAGVQVTVTLPSQASVAVGAV